MGQVVCPSFFCFRPDLGRSGASRFCPSFLWVLYQFFHRHGRILHGRKSVTKSYLSLYEWIGHFLGYFLWRKGDMGACGERRVDEAQRSGVRERGELVESTSPGVASSRCAAVLLWKLLSISNKHPGAELGCPDHTSCRSQKPPLLPLKPRQGSSDLSPAASTTKASPLGSWLWQDCSSGTGRISALPSVSDVLMIHGRILTHTQHTHTHPHIHNHILDCADRSSLSFFLLGNGLGSR